MTDNPPSEENASTQSGKKAASVGKSLFVLFSWLCVGASLYFIYKNWPGSDKFMLFFQEGRSLAYFELFGLLCLAQLFRGFRWATLLKAGGEFKTRDVVCIQGWYFLVMAFSPMRTGEFGRVLWARSQGAAGAWALGSIVAEKVFDMMILFSILGAAMSFSSLLPETAARAGILWLGLVVVIYVLMSRYSGAGAAVVETRAQNFASDSVAAKTVIRIANLLKGLSVISSPSVNITALLFTLLIWLLVTIGYWLFFSALIDDFSFTGAVTVLIFVALSSFVGVAPGNVGVFEMAVVLALQPFGVGAEEGLIVAIWTHLALISVFVVYGLGCRLILYRHGVKTL